MHGIVSLHVCATSPAPCAIPRRTITFQDGYSGFMEDPNPNIRWLLNQGRTPTANTGPIVDRTTGMAQGMIMVVIIEYLFQVLRW